MKGFPKVLKFATLPHWKQSFFSLLPLFSWLPVLLWSFGAQALTYSEALSAYSDQKFSKCYRIAMELADHYDGESRKQSKSLVLAAVAALELGKEQRAIKLYRIALDIDPAVDMPKIVKSRRVINFFEDVRSGKINQKTGKGTIVEVVSKSAFDETDYETYLPLGGNQFLQGKTLSGLAFGGLQAFALYYSYRQYTMAEKTEKTLRKKTVEVIGSGDYETTAFKKFRSNSQKSSARFRTESEVALTTAFVVYFASIVEILSNPPTRLKVVDTDFKLPARSIDSHITFGPTLTGGWFIALNVPTP